MSHTPPPPADRTPRTGAPSRSSTSRATDAGRDGGEAAAPAAPEEQTRRGADAASAETDTRRGPEAAAQRAVTPAPDGSALLVGPVSSDVDTAAGSSGLPGQHRGGFSRLPTAPVAVTVPSGPDEDAEPQWAPTPQAGPQRGLAAWALGFAVVGLMVSMFVGWGFPIGLVAVVSGFAALRRPTESRAVAGWAVVLGTASLIYSAGWLWFAATQTNLFS